MNVAEQPRNRQQTNQIYAFAEFRLDPHRRIFWRQGTPVQVKPKVLETLILLVESRDEVVTKERVFEVLWPGVVVEENNLSQNISSLRRLLGETPQDHRFIRTVPGRGYQFIADVELCKPEIDEPARSVPETPQPAFSRKAWA